MSSSSNPSTSNDSRSLSKPRSFSSTTSSSTSTFKSSSTQTSISSINSTSSQTTSSSTSFIGLFKRLGSLSGSLDRASFFAYSSLRLSSLLERRVHNKENRNLKDVWRKGEGLEGMSCTFAENGAATDSCDGVMERGYSDAPASSSDDTYLSSPSRSSLAPSSSTETDELAEANHFERLLDMLRSTAPRSPFSSAEASQPTGDKTPTSPRNATVPFLLPDVFEAPREDATSTTSFFASDSAAGSPVQPSKYKRDPVSYQYSRPPLFDSHHNRSPVPSPSPSSSEQTFYSPNLSRSSSTLSISPALDKSSPPSTWIEMCQAELVGYEKKVLQLEKKNLALRNEKELNKIFHSSREAECRQLLQALRIAQREREELEVKLRGKEAEVERLLSGDEGVKMRLEEKNAELKDQLAIVIRSYRQLEEENCMFRFSISALEDTRYIEELTSRNAELERSLETKSEALRQMELEKATFFASDETRIYRIARDVSEALTVIHDSRMNEIKSDAEKASAKVAAELERLKAFKSLSQALRGFEEEGLGLCEEGYDETSALRDEVQSLKSERDALRDKAYEDALVIDKLEEACEKSGRSKGRRKSWPT